MAFETARSRPLDNISAYIGNALPPLFREIGKSVSGAVRGAVIYAVAGVIFGYIVTQIPAINSKAPRLSYSPQLYLIVTGAFCGAMIGFIRGLRRGVKRIVTGQATTGFLFRDIIAGVVRHLDGPDSAERMKLMLRDLARQTNYTDYRHYSALAADDKLSAGFMLTFSRKIGECLDAASDQVTNEDFRSADKNQIVERFTAFCRDKSRSLLGDSVDNIFAKFLTISYITALVLFFLPVILFRFVL